MTVVYEKTEKHDGNDCILTHYYYVLEVSYDSYIAGYIEYYYGCWGRQVDHSSQTVTTTLKAALEFLGVNKEDGTLYEGEIK